jgi:hypothetical protein
MQNQLSEKQISEFISSWRSDNLLYLEESLGITDIWSLQAILLKDCYRAITEHKPIFIGSGHSLGKDFICAAISLWFLDCFTPSIVIQTAPTDRQVQHIMWGETLSKWNKKRINLYGKAYTSPLIEIRKEDWYLIGFTTKDSGASKDSGGGKFQGFHSPNICIIASEAQAIEDNIYDQIDAITTSENALVIYIGNPTRAKGRFAAGLRDKANNIVHHFSCLENPNYKEKKTIIPGLASYEWVENKRRRWGEDDPRWIGRVLGQIPEAALNNTFNQGLIDHMKSRHTLIARYVSNAGVSVDPAGEGVDDNILMAGNGGEVLNVYSKTLMSPSDGAYKAVEMCKQVDGKFVIVDCDGLGIGWYQEMCKLDKTFLGGIQILKFHGSASGMVKDGERALYANMRSEASFITQARAKAGKAAINPTDIELIEDLMEEEYFVNNRGLSQIEPKEDIKERLSRSPGRGDAYKMLQWAFNQNYRDARKWEHEREERSRLPAYAITGETEAVSRRVLPPYALA